MIIDATNLVLGRLASFAAKRAMQGEKIDIINCENAIISGSKSDIIAKYHHMTNVRGTPGHGPFISRMADRFVRKTIKGMLPHKKDKGRDALKNVMCYIGVPKEMEGKKAEHLKEASITERSLTRFIKVSELCKHIGGKQ